jgi:predicted permease
MNIALLRDLRYALRQLAVQPLINALAVLSLAVAIGTGVLLYSVVNAMLLRPVAGLAEPDRLVELGRPDGAGLDTVPYPVFAHLRDHGKSFDGLFAHRLAPLNLAQADGTQRTMALLVSGDYFGALGVLPAAGRLFGPEEDHVGAADPVAVVSHAAFQRYFGGDIQRVGGPVRINGQNLTLIGVAAADFRGHIAGLTPDFYLPLSLAPRLGNETQEIFANVNAYWLMLGARLAPGADLRGAQAELRTLTANLRPTLGERAAEFDLSAAPMRAVPAGAYAVLRWFAAFLFLLVLIVLLVACGNVAGLLVARGERRRQEISMRLVLGARRGAVMRQLLIETGVLAAAAGALGMALAYGVRALLLRIDLPTPIPVSLDIPIDGGVAAFALALVAFSTLAAGVAPSWRASGRAPQQALAGGMNVIGRGSGFRDVVVATQVGFTLVLLVVAGLFVRTLQRAQGLDPGFRVDGVAVADIDMEPAGYSEERQRQTLSHLLDVLRGRGGVEAVAAARVVPLSFSRMGLGGFLRDGAEPMWPDANVVAGDFFQVMDIAVRGRAFNAQDVAGAEPVVILNESAARLLAPQGDALGKQWRFGDERENQLVRVIGVTPDGRYSKLDDVDVPFAYFPYEQRTLAGMNLLVRGNLPAPQMDGVLAASMHEVDSDLPVQKSYRLADVLALALLPQRIARDVAATLGSVGLLLAALGLYGLMSSHVAARTREIGLRLALGAGAGRIRRDIGGRALRLVVWGVGLGLACALALSMLLESLLLGLGTDAVAFGAAGLVVSLTAALAIWEPMRRAAQVSPMVALRYE